MSWRIVIRPEVEADVIDAARWYEAREAGLGVEFVEEIIKVWDNLAETPLLPARRHSRKNVRWCYPERFPYRIIYEILETEHTVVVAAVLHAARHDRHWQQRIRK